MADTAEITQQFSTQVLASLDHLVRTAGDDPSRLADLLEQTPPDRLRTLLSASINRYNIRRNLPEETDRDRRDLRESLSNRLNNRIRDLQEETAYMEKPGQQREKHEKLAIARGIKYAEGIVRESGHLF